MRKQFPYLISRALSPAPLTLYLLPFTLFLSSCDPGLKAPEPDAGNADFHKFIAVGGDYLAGYQDGALYQKGQRNSLPALLAQQFALVGCEPFSQPLMPDDRGLGLNLKPWESPFVTASKLGHQTDCQGVTSLFPLGTQLTASTASIYLSGISGNSFQNLSVPFAKTADLFSTALSNSYANGDPNPYYYRFCSNAGNSTVYSDAVNQQATFIAVWTGMEDIYDYASHGGHNVTIAPASVFSAYLDTLLTGLTANGAKGVIANIPGMGDLPFYTTVPWNGMKLTQNKADSLNQLQGYLFNFVAGNNGFMIEYPNNSGQYRKLGPGENILLTVPLDSVKCDFLGAFTPLPDRYVLDSMEVQYLSGMIAAYNAVIVQKASQYGLALADMNAYFHSVYTGIKWDGVDMNAQFVSGGFYSLDGYHPNQKGYSLIANEFIRAVNAKFSSAIPWVNCPDCDGVIFP
jgi:hypothetical protein